MLLDQDALDNVLGNILATEGRFVGSNRDQILDVFETLDARIEANGDAAKYNRQRCADLKMGTLNAPEGCMVYQEKAHLLEVFDALEALKPVTKPTPVKPSFNE